MKKKLVVFLTTALMVFSMTACGSDPVLSQFENELDIFCTAIANADKKINSIDAASENAVDEMLACMDELNMDFQHFAELDFPAEYDYLEDLAGEAGSYMSEAVSNYHETFSNDSYNEYTAEYAHENYNRAYKRVKIIIALLHGEELDNISITTEE